MNYFRHCFLWKVALVAVWVCALTGYHHHHGERICLTFEHERSAAAAHRHSVCPEAEGPTDGRAAAGADGHAGCHMHCTTRICSFARYAAPGISRSKEGSLRPQLLPLAAALFAVDAAAQLLFYERESRPFTPCLTLCPPGGDRSAGGLRAPPCC